MPLFHFNVFDGLTLLDPVGTELANWKQARVEAIRYAGKLLQDDAQRIGLGEDWHMEVTDNTGLVLFRLDFNVMETAATMGMASKQVCG